MNECVFCSNSILECDAAVTLTAKGVDGIVKASAQRGENLNIVVGQSVHVECRKRYTNPKALLVQMKKRQEDQDEDHGQHSLRSECTFSYRDNCILCGCPDMYDGKKMTISLF
ncbi:unnamed protein product [Clavelina lepadiformis]|uniref:Uncharacterized protein n=1 Tax=Clavelina lepadiformis TaxID=159417 RepID=A0ABP0GA22_CLALP